MTPEEFAKHLKAHAKEIERAVASRWPRMMRAEAVEHFREGFRRGGFIDKGLDKWDVTRRQSVPFNGAPGKYTPLNSRTGSLMHSIDGRLEPGGVTIFSDEPHAKIHNEGGRIPVTKRMRRFFWAMHYESKQKYGAKNPEAQFWARMALKRGDTIRIPQRRFLGRSASLMKKLTDMLQRDLKRILNGK